MFWLWISMTGLVGFGYLDFITTFVKGCYDLFDYMIYYIIKLYNN